MRDKSIAILILMVIATAIAVGFVFWSNRNLPAQTIAQKSKIETPKEISQEEAINLALAQYPGEVFSSEITTLESEKDLDKVQTFWVIGVNLTTPVRVPSISNKTMTVNKVLARVDAKTKEVSVYKLGD